MKFIRVLLREHLDQFRQLCYDAVDKHHFYAIALHDGSEPCVALVAMTYLEAESWEVAVENGSRYMDVPSENG